MEQDSSGLHPEEQLCWQQRYSRCQHVETAKDAVFVHPDHQTFGGGRGRRCVADLQAAIDFLKRVTRYEPTKHFRQRVVVGYRHPLDEPGGRGCSPGWMPHWVNIPWGYLGRPDEPQDCCSHELVHPFFYMSPLDRGDNRVWGDGFCDFLRGFVLRAIGRTQAGEERLQRMRASACKKGDAYHDPAGQLILYAEGCGDPRRETVLQKALRELAAHDLNKLLRPTEPMLRQLKQ